VTALDRFDAKLRALRSWFEASHPPSYGIAPGFATAGPMEEPDVRQIEEEMGISLPRYFEWYESRLEGSS